MALARYAARAARSAGSWLFAFSVRKPLAGTANHLGNARMNKRRQMRWSPRGAHRVLQVRAAVLDGRFGQQAIQLAA